MNNYLELHALYHHGIKGQKWGIRRFQNEDGTLTPEGEAREAKIRKREEKILKRSSGANAVLAGVKTALGYGAARFIAYGVAEVARRKSIKAENFKTAAAINVGSKFVDTILGAAGTVHSLVNVYRGANERDKILERRKQNNQ